MFVNNAQDSDRQAWDDFVASQESGSFLQSWIWGEFQNAAGFKIRRLLFSENNVVLAACLLVARPLALGRSYWYSPWGPVFKNGMKTEEQQAVIAELCRRTHEARTNAEVFLRIEPKIRKSNDFESALLNAKYELLHRGVQPKDTLILNLNQSEDDILRQMHSKTRYNIRIAIRHGVTVSEETNEKGCEIFYKMAQEIERRGEFHYHKERYYQKMLEVLRGEQNVSFLVAKHNGDELASGIFIKFGDTYTYAHGASLKKKNHVMAPHLLHWEALMRAKKDGFSKYDFFGIAPGNDMSHPWFGISRFKRGFGGNEEKYCGAADVIYDKINYRTMNAARALKNIFVMKK